MADRRTPLQLDLAGLEAARLHLDEGAVTPAYGPWRDDIVKLLNGALATEQPLVGEFADRGPDGETGQRQRGRTVQRPAQRFGEFAVGHRRRAGEIDRPGQLVVVECEQQRADLVLQRDPRHVLAAAAQLGTQSQTEDRPQPGQQTTG